MLPVLVGYVQQVVKPCAFFIVDHHLYLRCECPISSVRQKFALLVQTDSEDAMPAVTGALCAAVQIESLRRFMPQLLYIRQPGLQKIPAASPNTAVANSLAEIFSAR